MTGLQGGARIGTRDASKAILVQGRVAVSTWAADQDHLALAQWACGRGHARGMPGRAGMRFRVVGDTDSTS